MKSVGLSQTSTPFESVATVIPRGSIRRRDTTFPPAGGCSSRARPTVRSSHGATASRETDEITSRRSASDGTATPCFSGATASTTRLSSWMRRAVTSRTSSRVMVGRNRRTRARSTSMPGLGSPVRKCETYSRA